MQPAARVQAAIEILDAVLGGEAAERALTRWARGSRYAGSKDRAAVRDHVFDALRRLRSSAWVAGLGEVAPADMSARAVMAGLLRGQGVDLEDIFTGIGHAPAPLDDPLPDVAPPSHAVAADLPDWLWARLSDDHGDTAAPIAAALRDRAPVILRANLLRTDRETLMAELEADGRAPRAHTVSPTAIVLDGNTRGLTATDAFREGRFELQDAGSQALVDRLPLGDGRVLDLCAGGGGKALALAARGAQVDAWDAEAGRMSDLPTRAARAGAEIRLIETPEDAAPHDGVVADVPCSGSGAWRRAPEARWRLTPEGLEALHATQDAILDRAVGLVRPGGWIAYMTCSLVSAENEARADAALARHGLTLQTRWDCTPLDGCDGFHLSLMTRS